MRVKPRLHDTSARKYCIDVDAPCLLGANNIQLFQFTLRLRALQRIAKSRRRLSPPLLLFLVIIDPEARAFATECHAHRPARRGKNGSHIALHRLGKKLIANCALGVNARGSDMANGDAAVVRVTGGEDQGALLLPAKPHFGPIARGGMVWIWS